MINSRMENIIHGGFLGLDLNAETFEAKVIILSVLSICLVVECAVALTAWYKMREHGDVNKMVTLCFFLCFFSAFTSTVVEILYHSWNIPNELIKSITLFLMSLSVFCFFASLLMTYIIRLHDTFASSVYRMSTTLIAVFSSILILGSVLGVGYIFDVVFLFETDFIQMAYYLILASFLLYFTGFVLAVYFFVSNLNQLALAMGTPPTPDFFTQMTIEMGEEQHKLSDLSSKYTMLFAFSIASTIVFVLTQFLVEPHFRGLFFKLDFCVNLWCLYLQFAFAGKHYLRCCGFCDKRCKSRGWRKTQKRIIHRRSVLVSASIGV